MASESGWPSWLVTEEALAPVSESDSSLSSGQSSSADTFVCLPDGSLTQGLFGFFLSDARRILRVSS